MSEKKEEEKVRVPRMMESLGWLTETTLQPRKGKPIEGVSLGSLVELKAQYYRTQEKAKNEKDVSQVIGRKRRNKEIDAIAPGLGSLTNRGVYERAKRDKLKLKDLNDDGKADVCYSALEEKAKIYNKLIQGEGESEEEERYEVDFLEKRYEMHKEIKDKPVAFIKEDIEEEKEEIREKAERALRRKMVLEEEAETKEGKERAKKAKELKIAKEKERRENLKKAFLKKQLEKIKANEKKQENIN